MGANRIIKLTGKVLKIRYYNVMDMILGANPGGGGGGQGDVSPHVFEGGGHNIKCPPPPPFLGLDDYSFI